MSCNIMQQTTKEVQHSKISCSALQVYEKHVILSCNKISTNCKESTTYSATLKCIGSKRLMKEGIWKQIIGILQSAKFNIVRIENISEMKKVSYTASSIVYYQRILSL